MMTLRIFQTAWDIDGARLGKLRREVFVVEQGVPEELEWDDFDATAVHFACEESAGGTVVGTARLVVDADGNKAIIGRLCVAKAFRQRKLATHIMEKILAFCAERRIPLVELHAQVYLRVFYEGLGFVAQGSEYLEAGIEHITMVKGLDKSACR